MAGPGEQRIETAEPDEFAQAIRPFAGGPVQVDPLRRLGFRVRTRARGDLPHLPLFQVRMEAGRVFSPPRPSVLSLSFVLQGSCRSQEATGTREVVPTQAHVRDATAPLDLSVLEATVFVANFDSDRIDRTARKLHDGPAWAKRRHGSWLPLTTPEGARFWRQLAATWRDLRDDAPWIRSRRAVAETEQRLAETLIDALTSGGADRAGRCGPVQLRRAEEFILAHLGDPILRADICEAAGVCTRSLSRAFARRHGVGPMTFLKQRRLEAAQRALLAADPSLRSVTEIAMESGLYHLGRFSIEYRSAFGESPSETLRR